MKICPCHLADCMLRIYCAGNLGGSQAFKPSEAPKYPTAFRTIMIRYALTAVTALGLRVYLMLVNKRRDQAVSGTGSFASEIDMDEDATDMHTPGFRYRL